MKLFKKITKEEETPFREWARANYKAGDTISRVWHPIVQNECALINAKAYCLTLELKRNPQ